MLSFLIIIFIVFFNCKTVKTISFGGGRWLTLLFIVFISCLSIKINLAIFSYDSYQMQVIAFKFNHLQIFKDEILAGLSGYPIMLPLLMSFYEFLNIDHIYYIQTYLGLNLLGTFVYLIIQTFKNIGVERKYQFPLAFLSVIFMISSYFMMFNIYYVNHHIIMAYLILVCIVLFYDSCLDKNAISQDNNIFYLINFYMIGMLFLRAESSLLIAMMTLIFVTIRKDKNIIYCIPFIISNLFSLVWGITLSQLVSTTADIVNPTYALILAMVNLTVIIYTVLIHKIDKRKRIKLLNVLLVLSLGVIGFAFITNTPYMLESCGSLITNLFTFRGEIGLTSGMWGVSPTICLILIIPLSFFSNLPNKRIFLYMIVFYLNLIIILGYLRNLPYRIGWGDSGNRMLIHITPLVIMYLFMLIGSLVIKSNQCCHNPKKNNNEY